MAAIIFDFDGTIADSFDVIVDIFHHITKQPERLSDEQMAELRGYPLQVVAERLKVPWWKIPFLLGRGRRVMARRMAEIPLFDGMGKVIEELYAEGHELFVISSNSKKNVRKFLKEHHLYKYFVDIQGNAGLLGKARIIRRVARANSFKIKECVYVGDETRDVLASHAVGMPVIAVSWGFANRKFLQEMKPTAMADVPQDIVRILEEL